MFLLHLPGFVENNYVMQQTCPTNGQESTGPSEKVHHFKSFQQVVPSPDVTQPAFSPGQPALPTAALLMCMQGRGRAARGIYRQPPPSHSTKGIENCLGGILCQAHIAGTRLDMAKTPALRN